MARKLPTFLQDDEPELLLKATTRQRDRLILMVGLFLGFRVSEIAKLKIEEIDFRKRVVWARQAKGDKDRAVPLPKVLLGPLRAWAGARKSGWLFESPRGGRLSIRAMQLLMKRVAIAAGLPRAKEPRVVTMHKLRHAFACRALEHGTIYDVQQLLGHSDISTTAVYLHTDLKKLTDLVDRIYE